MQSKMCYQNDTKCYMLSLWCTSIFWLDSIHVITSSMEFQGGCIMTSETSIGGFNHDAF